MVSFNLINLLFNEVSIIILPTWIINPPINEGSYLYVNFTFDFKFFESSPWKLSNSIFESFKNRVFIAGLENRLDMRYSKIIQLLSPVSFNDTGDYQILEKLLKLKRITIL